MTTFLSSQQLFYLRNNFFFFATTFLSSRQLFIFATTFYLRDIFFIFATTFLSSQQHFYLRDNDKRDNVSGVFCELQQCHNFFAATKQQSTISWPCNIVAEIVASAQLRQKKIFKPWNTWHFSCVLISSSLLYFKEVWLSSGQCFCL